MSKILLFTVIIAFVVSVVEGQNNNNTFLLTALKDYGKSTLHCSHSLLILSIAGPKTLKRLRWVHIPRTGSPIYFIYITISVFTNTQINRCNICKYSHNIRMRKDNRADSIKTDGESYRETTMEVLSYFSNNLLIYNRNTIITYYQERFFMSADINNPFHQ